jgi:hypothetical protein
VFQTVKTAAHVAVDERDPRARIHREPTVLSSEHVGVRVAAGSVIPAISAGSYGGKLGRHHFRLHEVLQTA